MKEVLCDQCGLVLGGPDGRCCLCPSTPLAVPAQGHPYRAMAFAEQGASCPRCSGRLIETSFQGTTPFECSSCFGLFLPRPVTDRLDRDLDELRRAFPKRPANSAANDALYIKCPVCSTSMNRVNFGQLSGVIVDVCRDHGTWFDAGEIHAVLDFVESGGLARASQRTAEELAYQKERLRQERQHDLAHQLTGRRFQLIRRPRKL